MALGALSSRPVHSHSRLVLLHVPTNTHCHLPNEQMKSIKGVSVAKWKISRRHSLCSPLIITRCWD